MMKYVIYILIAVSFAFNVNAGETRTMVLVTGVENDFAPLTNKELKRVYLGLPVTRNGEEVTPIRNHSDMLLHEVFLQHIIFMSSRNYERQLTSKTLRSGKKRISEHSSHQELINDMHMSKNGVTYLWEDDALKYPDVIILQRLWTGSAD